MEVPSQIIIDNNTKITNFRYLINSFTILHTNIMSMVKQRMTISRIRVGLVFFDFIPPCNTYVYAATRLRIRLAEQGEGLRICDELRRDINETYNVQFKRIISVLQVVHNARVPTLYGQVTADQPAVLLWVRLALIGQTRVYSYISIVLYLQNSNPFCRVHFTRYMFVKFL